MCILRLNRSANVIVVLPVVVRRGRVAVRIVWVVSINLCGLVLNLVRLHLVNFVRVFIAAKGVRRWPCGQHLGRHLKRKLDGSTSLPYIVSTTTCCVWASVIRKSPPLFDSIVVNCGLRLAPLSLLSVFSSMSLVRLLLLNTAPCLVRPGYMLRRIIGTYVHL